MQYIKSQLVAPVLSLPADNATDVALRPTLEWAATPHAETYVVEIASENTFTDIVYTGSSIPGTSHVVISKLEGLTDHYWRVYASRPGEEQGPYSQVHTFTTTDRVPVRHYYITDHLGSVRATVDETGLVTSQTDYYPFGLVMPNQSEVGAEKTKENYTGHELDEETGLVYAGARYYMPEVGRWTSVDPLAANYAAWSPYHYSYNNPNRFVDPDGRFIIKGAKALFNVGRRVHKTYKKTGRLNLKSVGKALKNEALDIVDNVSTLVDGQLTIDDAFAIVDLATGFGAEAKRGANALGVVDDLGDVGKRTDDIRVIGRLDDTAVAKDWPGHEVLDVADWDMDVNDVWMKTGIENKATFYAGSPITKGNRVNSNTGRTRPFGRELEQLEEAGYVRQGDYYVHPDNLQ